MATALSKTFKSPVVDTIQSLPQHQQIIICSAAKAFRGTKKDATIGEVTTIADSYRLYVGNFKIRSSS